MDTLHLPPLREELRLYPTNPNSDGSPAWLLQDPIANRFFRIGWIDFELLLRWSSGNPKQIIESINTTTTLTVSIEDLKALFFFLEQNNLLQVSTQDAVEGLQQRAVKLKNDPINWLIRHYLFFRIPLIRPQIWLKKLSKHLTWLYSGISLWVLLIISLIGIILVARQWDSFSNTLIDKINWSGLPGFVIAMACAKILHEMGHALTATHYGVRVAHMGFAMVVLMPMLYTDTTESWKLNNPRQRLAIASAGIIAELALAGLSTLCWTLLPPGSVKDICFFLATTSLMMSLTINASPFMRFDGYFILSDLIDIPNLHERSSALCRTWLRRTLLGLNDPWTEHFQRYGNTFLITFAILTWLYRLTVFLGIALLVYHFFFKLLGIILFIVEIAVFIAQPIYSELKIWNKRKDEIPTNRRYLFYCLAALILISTLIPWKTNIKGVGWSHAEQQQVLYTPLPGKLITLPKSREVTKEQTLFVIEAPELSIAAEGANSMAQSIAKEINGLVGLPEGEKRRAVLHLQQQKFLAEAKGYQQQQSRLIITAPFNGFLYDLDSNLAPGVWVNQYHPLAVLVNPEQWVIDAYLAEEDISRVQLGMKTLVEILSSPPDFIPGKVISIDPASTTTLPHHILDANTGGLITTVQEIGKGGKKRPRETLYHVKISIDAPPKDKRIALCKVTIYGSKTDRWPPLWLKYIISVLIRESGF